MKIRRFVLCDPEQMIFINRERGSIVSSLEMATIFKSFAHANAHRKTLESDSFFPYPITIEIDLD